MCHAERAEVVAWLQEHGATPDDAEAVRRKVVRARGEHEAEQEIAALWEDADDGARIEAGARLYADHPGDARIAYEYAGTHDSAGDPAAAVPLYEEALAAGLREPYRHRAQLQLASSLRNLGRLDQAVALVDDVAARHPDSLGAAAFRALVRHDAGQPTQALAELLAAVAAGSTDPDVVRYRRALSAYAAELRG
jgi:cyanophycin synthetase